MLELACDNCGAPLPARPGDARAMCTHCGTIHQLPVDLPERVVVVRAADEDDWVDDQAAATQANRSTGPFLLGGCLVILIVALTIYLSVDRQGPEPPRPAPVRLPMMPPPIRPPMLDFRPGYPPSFGSGQLPQLGPGGEEALRRRVLEIMGDMRKHRADGGVRIPPHILDKIMRLPGPMGAGLPPHFPMLPDPDYP